MNKWLPANITLEGQLVRLVPLKKEHLPDLQKAAEDKKIWEFYPMDCSVPERFTQIYEEALSEKKRGAQYPFVIYHQQINSIIGSTRYLDISGDDKKLEIGWTWIRPEFWTSAINPECKLLLLTYAFETLKAIRVQFKTDTINMRSRIAIEKLGAQFEGIHRNDRIRDNGTFRSSVYYSILADEWPLAKQRLTSLYENKKKAE